MFREGCASRLWLSLDNFNYLVGGGGGGEVGGGEVCIRAARRLLNLSNGAGPRSLVDRRVDS